MHRSFLAIALISTILKKMATEQTAEAQAPTLLIFEA